MCGVWEIEGRMRGVSVEWGMGRVGRGVWVLEGSDCGGKCL